VWGKALYKQFYRHEREDEARHSENVHTMGEIENAVRDQAKATRDQAAATMAAIDKQAAEIKKLTDALAAMTPTFPPHPRQAGDAARSSNA